MISSRRIVQTILNVMSGISSILISTTKCTQNNAVHERGSGASLRSLAADRSDTAEQSSVHRSQIKIYVFQGATERNENKGTHCSLVTMDVTILYTNFPHVVFFNIETADVNALPLIYFSR